MARRTVAATGNTSSGHHSDRWPPAWIPVLFDWDGGLPPPILCWRRLAPPAARFRRPTISAFWPQVDGPGPASRRSPHTTSDRQLLSRPDLPQPWADTTTATMRLIDELSIEIAAREDRYDASVRTTAHVARLMNWGRITRVEVSQWPGT